MNDQLLLDNIKKIKSNLELVNNNLKSVQDILNESIKFNNDGFKSNEVSIIITKVDNQINNLNSKIISNLKDM